MKKIPTDGSGRLGGGWRGVNEGKGDGGWGDKAQSQCSFSFNFPKTNPSPKPTVCVLFLGVNISFLHVNRLVGLVVKASASRAEDPGFESRLRRDFFGVESYQ